MSQNDPQSDSFGGNKNLDAIKAKIQEQHDEMSKEQRFGYFSLIYPQTVGDGAYSQNKEMHHKIIEGKVVTEKRGIYTQPAKKGHGHDAFFSQIEPTSQEEFEKMKQLTNEIREKYIQRVKDRKEERAIPKFKPCGSQEYKDYFEQNPVVYDKPITSEKKLNVKIVDKQVITEKRGILTNPTKLGSANVPGALFSYPGYVIAEEVKSEKKKEPSAYKKPFAPASLSKNECFATAKETYGGDDSKFKELLEEFRTIKKNGKTKYQNILPSGSTKHIKPFAPPRLVSSGREALFNDDLYKIPPLEGNKISAFETLKMKKEKEQNRTRAPFTYNKIMNHSTFSPPITSFSCNLKREFPSISFH